jgi:Methenyl tetrahydrofolate cyclohydrolase
MSFITQNLDEFSAVLASKAATPGGGGGSAMVGALGMALGTMVANLTTGKKKYVDVEEDIQRIIKEGEEIRLELLHLIDRDEEVFLPVAEAYSLPKGPEKDAVMEPALRDACSVPMDIMRQVCRAIDLHEELSQKSNQAISDIGVGVIACKAALLGASLNVYINTKSMLDKEHAAALEKEADDMVAKYSELSEKIFWEIEARLR